MATKSTTTDMKILRSLRAVSHAIERVLRWRWGRPIFFGAVVAFLILFIVLLVKATPGNDIVFQLQIMRWSDYLLMGSLAILSALLLAMQIYSIKQSRDVRTIVGAVGRGSIGSLPAFLATILGTASCSACVAGLFGFLGLGGILFILEYRWWFVASSLVVIVAAIVLTARKVEHLCKACAVRG